MILVPQVVLAQLEERLPGDGRVFYEIPSVSARVPFQEGSTFAGAGTDWMITANSSSSSLFTDHRFHSLTIGFSKVERKLPELAERLAALRKEHGALGGDVLGDADVAALGRFVVTLDPRDVGAFKTPSLRNVARTGPYMHDGSVATLGEAVDLEVYARGAHDNRPILTPAERDDLVAFLQALTSDAAPGDAHRGSL